MLIALEEDNFFELKILRKHNRYAYLRVKPNRVIEVSAPMKMPQSSIYELLYRKKAWIIETSDALGEHYGASAGEETIQVMPLDKGNMKQIKLQMEAQAYDAMERLYPLVKPYDIGIPDIHVRLMTKKWGSCIAEKYKVWLNAYLIKMPLECTDYILLRQLLHLRYPEENEAYFQLLRKLMPEWKQYEAILSKVRLPQQKVIATSPKLY